MAGQERIQPLAPEPWMIEQQHESLHEHTVGSSFSIAEESLPFVRQALADNDTARLRDLLVDFHAADVAELLALCDRDEREALLNYLSQDFDPEVLTYLESDLKDEVIDLLGAEKSAEAITQLESDDAAQVMEALEEEQQQEILEAIKDEEQRGMLEEVLSYPEDSAGRLMNTNYVAVPIAWNVGQTIDYLRENDYLPDDFYTIFVVDEQKHPLSAVKVSRAIRSNRDTRIQDIMEETIHILHADQDQEEVAHIFRKYALVSAAVVDGAGRMAGIISVDDIVDVISEEAQEDIMRMGGVTESDINAPVIQTAVGRFPWLFINLITCVLVAATIGLFQGAIAQIVTLAVLMPVVASMAGNAGVQTMTVVVRALSSKELTTFNALRVVRKEIVAGLLNGIGLGIIASLSTEFYYGDWGISVVLGVAILSVIIIAALSGALIPLMLQRMGSDPAVSSSVVLTTVTDVTSFFIFLGLAALFLL